MITSSTIYWITRLDVIVTISFIIATLSFIGAIIMGLISIEENDVYTMRIYPKEDAPPRKNHCAKTFCGCLIVCAISLVVCAFVPTTKQMAAIIILPKVVNSEKIQAVGNELHELAIGWLNELKPSKKGENK